jgi:hypothetical protein
LDRPPENLRRGFLLAGAINLIGVPILTHGFTNATLASVDPAAFSTPGTLLILCWGLAYIAASGVFHRAPLLCLAFAGEKAIYAARWCVWFTGERASLGALWDLDPATGVFYAIYGLVDGSLLVFFLVAWWRVRKPTT